MSASLSIRSACASGRTRSSASRRSKAPCPNAPCAASRALHPAQGLDWPKNLPRPARLFASRRKVEAVAELPDHPPRLFIWRNIRHRVAKADGPERIHGEWWVSESETNLVRDYYRVETADGARYWLFRDAPAEQGGGWWLHGVGEA